MRRSWPQSAGVVGLSGPQEAGAGGWVNRKGANGSGCWINGGDGGGWVNRRVGGGGRLGQSLVGSFTGIGALTELAVTRGGRSVTLKQESEHKPVRDKGQRYHDDRNEVSGTQLTWLDPHTDKTLIECVEQIRTAPEIEHPDQDDSQPALESRQREQGQDCGSEVTVCSWKSESARQVRRDNAGHQECQPDEPEAVQEE